MHEDNPNYGVASVHYAPIVTQLINRLGFDLMLDYGCGKGRLAENLRPDHQVVVAMYDPGRPGYDDMPDSAPFVTCIDVLEHIEPDCLEDVLDDLVRVTERIGFFTVHTGPAAKTLSDGRNAHLIQEPAHWWLEKFMSRFNLLQFNTESSGFYVTVQARAA